MSVSLYLTYHILKNQIQTRRILINRKKANSPQTQKETHLQRLQAILEKKKK